MAAFKSSISGWQLFGRPASCCACIAARHPMPPPRLSHADSTRAHLWMSGHWELCCLRCCAGGCPLPRPSPTSRCVLALHVGMLGSLHTASGPCIYVCTLVFEPTHSDADAYAAACPTLSHSMVRAKSKHWPSSMLTLCWVNPGAVRQDFEGRLQCARLCQPGSP